MSTLLLHQCILPRHNNLSEQKRCRIRFLWQKGQVKKPLYSAANARPTKLRRKKARLEAREALCRRRLSPPRWADRRSNLLSANLPEQDLPQCAFREKQSRSALEQYAIFLCFRPALYWANQRFQTPARHARPR